MKKIFLIIFTIFCYLFPVFSQTSDIDHFDTQLWHETQLNFPLVKRTDSSGETTDKLSLFLNGNLRAGRNIRHFVDERIGFGFDYKHNKYISFTPSYLYIAQQPAPGRKQYENRVRFAVNLENSWKRFSVDDRNLVEYRFRNNSANSVRYRNRLRFLYPIKKDKTLLFIPFAANEVFYDFQARTFSRNEFSIGLSRKISPNATTDIFYLLQTNKSGLPKQLNVFGINLKIKID
jgi:hypothetical protein